MKPGIRELLTPIFVVVTLLAVFLTGIYASSLLTFHANFRGDLQDFCRDVFYLNDEPERVGRCENLGSD